MTVIDLGEMRGRVTDEPPPPRRARDLRLHRLAAVVVVTLLLSGAAVPADPPFTRVGQMSASAGDQMWVTGHTAYVVKMHAKPPEVEAYDVRGGRRLWTVPYPLDEDPRFADAVLLGLDRRGLTVASANPSLPYGVAALDPATGRLRWRVGTVYAEFGGQRLLAADAARSTLSLMDGVTGRTFWSIPFTGCAVASTDALSTVAVQCDGNSTLRLLDVTTGTFRTSRDLADAVSAWWRVPDSRQSFVVTIVARTVAVIFQAGVDARIMALNLADLSDRWAEPVPVPGGAFVFDCGDDVCAGGGSDSVRLDAATGARLGRVEDYFPDSPPVALDVLGGHGVTRPPAIVLQPVANEPDTISSGRDDVVGMWDGPHQFPLFAGGYPTWVLRAVPDRRAATGYRFATVGRLDGVLASACFATRRYLACATATDRLTFFDLPVADRVK